MSWKAGEKILGISATFRLIINHKPHATVHKIYVTSRGIWSDMFISDVEASKDTSEISVKISCSCLWMMIANSN